MTLIGSDVEIAASHLRDGRLVAIPTETVYGLAALGLNSVFVEEIFKAKGRPSNNPLILHVADVEMARSLVSHWPDEADLLVRLFWPGPLTLVLPAHSSVPSIVTAGLDTVAVRMPDHILTLELIRRLNAPLAAPSANPSGFISPTHALQVAQFLGDRVAYILDGGIPRVGIESTIIRWKNPDWEILRPGSISSESLKLWIDLSDRNDDGNLLAPGMMKKHYAPQHPLQLFDNTPPAFQEGYFAIFYQSIPDHWPAKSALILSPKGRLEEAARNLYYSLHYADNLKPAQIFVQKVPAEGIGIAINDRLSRAAHREK